MDGENFFENRKWSANSDFYEDPYPGQLWDEKKGYQIIV